LRFSFQVLDLMLPVFRLTETISQGQYEWSLIHRVHLDENLKRRATSRNNPGYPVELRTACCAVEVDPAPVAATMDSGERVRGDITLGADGAKMSVRPSGGELARSF